MAAVSVLAAVFIAWPLVVRSTAAREGPPGSSERALLEEEIERALGAIRELEFDHRAGNLTDEDFSSLDAAERARAADLLRRRDALGADEDPPA